MKLSVSPWQPYDLGRGCPDFMNIRKRRANTFSGWGRDAAG